MKKRVQRTELVSERTPIGGIRRHQVLLPSVQIVGPSSSLSSCSKGAYQQMSDFRDEQTGFRRSPERRRSIE